ncbi:T9SS type A sorting domain-containing protein [Flavobacterium zepuense]|uniref:T9SS type A sorting domain-containing protein n=1 Tax=Flavobacterium zepuense TaxID=2593302 RepID=A0A552V496_9FLAO|nr:choice-of-anchor J domain-containing protein [Flavobacterium zepuense]TRW25300.1 T9SS type A sorting domain-containing protein [Flavobacterium zepuense]
MKKITIYLLTFLAINLVHAGVVSKLPVHDPVKCSPKCAPVENPVATFFENFDGVATPGLPAGWSSIIRGENINEFAFIETFDYSYYPLSPSVPNVVRIGNGNTSNVTDEIILVTPELSTLNSGTHRLRFMASGNNYGVPMHLEIVTLNNNTNTAVATYFATVDTENDFFAQQYIVDFSGYTGTDTYIGIKLVTPNWGQDIFIDNVTWEATPVCPDVALSSIAVTQVTPDGATADWDTGAATSWQVVQGSATATNPDALTPQTVTESGISFTGLEPFTKYAFWVRSVCTGGNGAWIGPIYFKTDCDPVTEFNENFDDESIVTPAMPDCWTDLLDPVTFGLSSASVQTIQFPSIAVSGPNAVVFNKGLLDTAGNDKVILVSPRVSNIGAGTHRFRFFARSGSPDVLEVITLNGNNKYADITVVQSFTITSATMTEHVINFDEVTVTDDVHLGLRYRSNSTASSSMYVDNVVWEPIPDCPDVSGIAVNGITTTTATITWTAGGSETAWEAGYSLGDDTNPAAIGTVAATTTPTAEITTLTPQTDYNVWVRSVCDDGNGLWIGPIAFSTACLAVDAFSENFDNNAIYTMPVCWSAIKRGETLSAIAQVTTINVPEASATSVPNNVSIYKGDSGLDDDLIIVSPQVTNLNAGTHHLTFNAFIQNFAGELQIGTLSSNNPDDAVFTSLQSIPLTVSLTPAPFTVNFSAYTGSDTYIGIRLYSASQHTAVYLDNIVWEPACPTVTNVSAEEITTVAANITWTAGEAETEWQVVYTDDAEATPGSLTPIDVTGETVTLLTELTPATTYTVWVRSLCDSGNGVWVPFTFTTQCLAVDSFDENLDTTALHEIPACWTGILRGNTLAENAIIETAAMPGESAPNVIAIYKADSDVTDDLILVSPQLTNLNAGTHYLTFYAFVTNGSTEVQVGTLNNNTNDAVFTTFTTVSVASVMEPQSFTIDLTGYTGTDTYIGLRLNSNVPHTVVLLDNLKWQTALGTPDFDNSAFSYYPNPVNDVLTVSYTNDINTISIYNLLGQNVLEQNINATTGQVNMQALAAGTYLVKVTAGSNHKYIKIVKQ